MRPEDLYLSEMLEAVEDIEAFVAGHDLDSFLADKQARYAVVFALQTLGEAAARLPESLRIKYPDIPWQEMIGQRNVIAHGYFALRWEDIWETALRDVPLLRGPITAIRDSLLDEGS
jgi:uncharacterized protein with HEPN domain